MAWRYRQQSWLWTWEIAEPVNRSLLQKLKVAGRKSNIEVDYRERNLENTMQWVTNPAFDHAFGRFVAPAACSDVFGTEHGTPDLIEKRTSELGCGITAAVWCGQTDTWSRVIHFTSRTCHKITVDSSSQEQKIPATNNLHEPQLRLPYSHPVLL
jgi:hypothetical protein